MRPASKSVAMQAHAGGTLDLKLVVTFVQVGIPTLDLKLVIAYAALQIMVEVHGAVKVRQCHGGFGVGVWSCCCLARPWLRRVRKLLSWTIQVAGAEPEI